LLREHPLPKLFDAGVACSVTADDPRLFATSLLGEYERCRDTFGLSDAQLASIAWSSLEASSAPPELTKRACKASSNG
jgi:adenosine deaminase